MLTIMLMLNHTNVSGYDFTTDDVLVVDEPIPDATVFDFPEEDVLDPKLSEFIILTSLMMSSSSGERWATVTIKNTNSHRRILDEDHIVAVFANGDRRNPVRLKHSFKGHEEISLTLSFGMHKFPILRLLTRN